MNGPRSTTSQGAADELRRRLSEVPDADLDRGQDRKRHIGSNIWRLRWHGQLAVAVPGSAGDKVVRVAPFCALYVLENKPSFLTRSGPLDESVVNVLISRDVPDNNPTETEQVMRSIRDAAQQGHPRVDLRIWYWGGSDGQRDEEPAPTWPEDCGPTEWSAACTKADEWVENLLLPRLNEQPGDLAIDLVARVADPSLRISSSAIKLGVQNKWSLRIDGLEIGVANDRKVTLSIGKDHQGQTAGPGYERRIFIEVFGSRRVTVGRDGDSRDPDELTLDEATEKVRTLLSRFRRAGSGDWVIRARTEMLQTKEGLLHDPVTGSVRPPEWSAG